MKTKLIVLSFVAFAILSTVAVVVAYDRGRQRGGDEERACWTLESVPIEAWHHGEITARRDTRKHPFGVKPARIILRGDHSVNSIPVRYSP